jgi:hypothetical protein
MKTDFDLLGIRVNIALRSRRRWLVALIYAGFAALVIASFAFSGQFPGEFTLGLIILFGFALLSKFLGGGSYRDGLVPPFTGGDERERNRRYRASYVAYQYLDFAFFPAVGAAFFKANPHNMPANPAARMFFDSLPFELLIAGCILYYTLPQVILLWTEPDMETEAETPSA